MKVTKSNGIEQEFDWNKIEAFYKRVAYGYNTKCPFSDLRDNLSNKLVEWIATKDITKMIEKSALDLISTKTPEWSNIAWRMKLRSLYKRASKNKWITNSDLYSPEYFADLIEEYVWRWLYHKSLLEQYTREDLLEIGKFLDVKIDDEYNFPTVQYYERRYLLNRDWIIRELPQHMYLAISMFLMKDEKEDRNKWIRDTYRATAQAKISLPTPNLLNARTPNSQLSSCFILDVDDDLRGIYHSIENMAQISKNGWWLWVYLWNIRAKWSMIKDVYWLSWWTIPWVKVINDTGIAVNQMGKRAWAISVTLDVFHLDIFRFLDLQTETWDIRAKSFDVFPAVAFPDLFFKRLEANENFTLFCPYEVEKITWIRLQDLWWDEFEEAYKQLENDDRLQLKETHPSKDIFKAFLKVTVETWMPYTFFRDTVNRLNPNKHNWVIHCSNLCCVTGDTRIATEDWLVTVEELYKTKELMPLKVTTDKRTESLKLDEKWIVIRDSIWIYKTWTLQTYIVDTNAWYQIKATDYHKLYIKKGKKIEKLELKDIKVWDKLLIQSDKWQFWKEWNYYDWLIMWLITWDWTFDWNTAIVDLYNEDMFLEEELLDYINSIVDKNWSWGYQKISWQKIQHTEKSQKIRIASSRLWRYLDEKYWFNRTNKLSVSESIFKWNEDFVRWYLQWINLTDWTVGKQSWWVQFQLTSINKDLLSDIQILLSNFWIYSSIYNRNTEWKSTFSYVDKNWIYKEYINQASYRLDVNWINSKKLLEEDLIRWIKKTRLKDYINSHWEFNKKNFYSTITSIEKWDIEDVYDTTEEVTNSVIFNWIVSWQCEIAQNQSAWVFKQEIRTEEWNVIIEYIPWDTVICNLASINVAKVNTKKDMEHIFPIITRLLDNVIDLNAYPIEETRISAEKYRAIGIWYMWVAQYLAENKLLYWSKEAIERIDELFKEYAFATLTASVQLAKERWAYPAFPWSDFSKWIAFWKDLLDFSEADYWQRDDWGELKYHMETYWTRFWYHSAPAPNTSTAGVVGTTAWVVPIYKRYFVETNQIAPTITIAPNLNDENFWFYQEYTKMKMPWVIDTVATIQKWIDQSVSFEWMFNPADTSPADLYNYWIQAWKAGLKTVYYVRSQSLEVDKEDCASCSG